MNWEKFLPLVKMALKEDIGKKDITTDSVIPKQLKAEGKIFAKKEGVLCGLELAELVFKVLDPKIEFKKIKKDGDKLKASDTIALLKGSADKMLQGERISLNFLQRLSGIATLTNRYVTLIKPYKAKILDTRKTTPGLRALEKYAVRTGGGQNHRMGLWDAVLIKDNHINLVGLKTAVTKAGKLYKKVEVETESLSQVKEALESGANIIMLDNMDIKTIIKAIKLINKKALIEVSGGVNLDNVRDIAKTGVDWISIGRLTHSPEALDISFDIKK